MIVSHIVATDTKNVIGREGVMPWHLSADLKRFKRLTMDHCMIMGRKTYESIGKALPGRVSIVVTRQEGFELSDAIVVSSIDAALAVVPKQSTMQQDEVFIIGGGELYRQTLPLVDKIHLTRIHRDAGGGDTFYPEIPEEFKEIEREDFQEAEEFSFITYAKLPKN